MTHDPHAPDTSDTVTPGERCAVMRRRLPNRRLAETFELEVNGHRYVVTIGRFENGEPGEIFINSAKTGSQIDRAARDSAVLASLGLQHGISVEVLARALSRTASGKPDSVLCAVLDRLAAKANMGTSS
jgi:hypothetical protein